MLKYGVTHRLSIAYHPQTSGQVEVRKTANHLPTEIYALVSQHRVAKDLWEKIKLLMQGTSLTKQERECKLYDKFDKFTYKKGESLHEYYLSFTLLLNDMNIYKIPLEQFQVNTKFLNTLPDEWSKFVTDVKLVKESRYPRMFKKANVQECSNIKEKQDQQSSPITTGFKNTFLLLVTTSP
ncbi:hypothetical protein Tco_0890917 [Tanacetum coccineum]|uniref:Integrase catalytic domain-containing protein n=1 Tax=Tanacetum coccineum TaxID=301880 RepID=A0ABQ5C1E8_9ASTR